MAATPTQSDTSADRYERAQAFFRAGNYQGCLQETSRLLSEQPRHDAGQMLHGMALLELDRPAEAIAAFRAAIDLTPDNEEAWRQLGVGLMTDGHWADAAEAFEEALRLSGQNVRAMVDLSNVRFVLGQTDEALATLEEACRQRPGDRALLRNLVGMYESAEMPEAALRATEQILELNPDDVPAQCDAAWLMMQCERLDEAAAIFRRLEHADTEHELYAIHGQVMVEIRRRAWRRALALAIEATRLDRYDFTTALLSYISSKVFDQESEITEQEMFERFERDHREHRRLHAEVVL